MSQPSLPTPSSVSAQRLQSEMGFLMELCTVVASNTELQPILDWIVNKTTSLLGADEGSIKLIGADAAAPAHTIVHNRMAGPEGGSATWPTAIKASVMGYLMMKDAVLATPDLIADERFGGLKGMATQVRALLAVPLKVDGRVTGMLALWQNVPGRNWRQDEQQLLSIVASNSAGVIEQARLRSEAEARQRLELEKKRLERELDLARDIQMGLVPGTEMRHGPWEVHGRVVAARQVGGDYFDYYPLDADRFAVTIADVSGKGVPAALLVSTVQASLRAFCNGVRPIAEAMHEINRGVVRSASGGKFVTLFYGEVDHVHGLMRFANGGHNYPLLRRANGEIVELKDGGLPLGLFEDATFKVGEIAFGEGDALLLYSDGISEAVDTFDNQFGEERLLEMWRAEGHIPAGEFLGRLFTAVGTFRGSAAQSDDMTAVVVGPRLGG